MSTSTRTPKAVVAQRQSEPQFLRAVRNQQPEVNGIKVIKVGRFRPGDQVCFASAYVITYRGTEQLFHPWTEDEANYCTHELVWDDENGRWRLLSGNYDLTWAQALEDLVQR